MSEKKKIRIKAAKDAPESVSHGNFDAENVNGYFETTDERFAEFIRQNYGVAGGEKGSAPAKKKTAAKKRSTRRPAAAETNTEASPAAEKAAEGGTE